MADEISLNEALDIAKQLQNHYKAFAKLYQVIAAVPRAQAAAAEAHRLEQESARKIESLKQSVESASADAAAEVKKIQAHHQQYKTDLVAAHQSEVQSIRHNMQQLTSEWQALKAKVQQEHDALQSIAARRTAAQLALDTEMQSSRDRANQDMQSHLDTLRADQDRVMAEVNRSVESSRARLATLQQEIVALEATKSQVIADTQAIKAQIAALTDKL